MPVPVVHYRLNSAWKHGCCEDALLPRKSKSPHAASGTCTPASSEHSPWFMYTRIPAACAVHTHTAYMRNRIILVSTVCTSWQRPLHVYTNYSIPAIYWMSSAYDMMGQAHAPHSTATLHSMHSLCRTAWEYQCSLLFTCQQHAARGHCTPWPCGDASFQHCWQFGNVLL